MGWFITQLAGITEFITPNDIPRQIANAHTIFNVVNAFLLIGFTVPIGRLIMKLYPAKIKDGKEELELLDEYYLQHPGMAVDLVDKELGKLADEAISLLKNGLQVTLSGSATELEQLRQSDKSVDFHQKQILSYLQQLQQEQLGEKESNKIKKQLEIANILEAASDIITTDMVEAAQHRTEKGFQISAEARSGFDKNYNFSLEAMNNAFAAYQQNNKKLANQVLSGKKTFKKNTLKFKEYLIERLSVQDKNRIDIIRFETEIVELTSRLFSLARRVAKLQLE